MTQAKLTRSNTDVYTMPLTEVSLEHGTEGLYERLQHTLGRVGLADNELIQASIQLGLKLHANDTRTYEPYNNHILRVPLRLIEDLGITDPNTVAAAPLHDSVEDHSKELVEEFFEIPAPTEPRILRPLGFRALQIFVNRYDAPLVVDRVEAVTNPLWIAGSQLNLKYKMKIRHIVERAHPESRPLKYADGIDNMTATTGEKIEKRRYLDEKQIETYDIYINGLDRWGSLIVGEFRERTLAQLHQLRAEAVERLGYDPRDSHLSPAAIPDST